MKSPYVCSAILALSVAATAMPAGRTRDSRVTPFPAIPGLVSSDVYAVTVNGVPVWTEKFRTHFNVSKFPEWFIEPKTRVQQEIHQASFSCEDGVEIAIRVAHPIGHAAVRPLSRKIETLVSGGTLTFSIPGPEYLVVEIDSLPPLFLFACSPEWEKLTPSDPGVHYFGPGVHRPGYITMKEGETVYLAPGALVYGGIRARGVGHIRVTGRGILDGAAEFSQMVLVENSHDVQFDGVMIRNGDGWTNTIVNCDSVEYSDVRVLSFGPAGDGIDPLNSRHVAITGCFLRCTDDCIAVKAPQRGRNVDDILISSNTMLGYAFSDGATIGFETNADSITNVVISDCDVLQARGGSRVEGHSGFSIICDGPAVISNVAFVENRVENAEEKLFELNVTDGTKYGTGPPGHIQNILVRDVSWSRARPIIIRGFDGAHRVSNVIFDGCTVEGKPLRTVREGVMQIGQFAGGVVIR